MINYLWMSVRKRLPDFTALKLGLVPNKSGRYRLKERHLKQLHDIDMHGIKRLFFDIETSPMQVYTWRTGYNLNIGHENIIEDWKIICVCWKWEGEDKVHELRWDHNQCDASMVRKFIDVFLNLCFESKVGPV